MKRSLGADTLALPTPVWCVAAYDAEGRANAMTIAWGGICCSKPPMLTVALRPATHTHGLILQRKAFSVNVADVKHAKEADYFGMASGKDVDKFAATGLTAVKAKHVDAPVIQEFPVQIECELAHTHDAGLHTVFFGEIKDVFADEGVLKDGKLSMDLVDPLVFGTGTRGYFGIGEWIGKAFSIGRGYMK